MAKEYIKDAKTGKVTTRVYTPVEPTVEEIEQEVENITKSITDGNIRDRALAMTLADIVSYATGKSTEESRQIVRDRIVKHIRSLKGLE